MCKFGSAFTSILLVIIFHKVLGKPKYAFLDQK